MLVNADRGNSPFAEIPDANTQYWHYNNVRTTTIPASNIDLYAEVILNTSCEPREIQKGNTARAMYYVLTMYQLGDTTDAWWTVQRDILYAWHVVDPADAREITRTRSIAAYQQNKVNPFVLDSTLIRRAYFPTMGVTAAPGTGPGTLPVLLQNAPNPFRASTTISYSLAKPSTVQLRFYNILGQTVHRTQPQAVAAGTHTVTWNSRGVPQGVYFYQLTVDDEVVATRRMTLVK